MLREIGVAMMGAAFLVAARGCALKTEESALKAASASWKELSRLTRTVAVTGTGARGAAS